MNSSAWLGVDGVDRGSRKSSRTARRAADSRREVDDAGDEPGDPGSIPHTRRERTSTRSPWCCSICSGATPDDGMVRSGRRQRRSSVRVGKTGALDPEIWGGRGEQRERGESRELSSGGADPLTCWGRGTAASATWRQ